ncbi:MAG: PAAR domain-containing protein [Polyangiaceae bacterium]|nr:PAAR domain-containing protein [Polyangiaceae bacterium]MBK8942442.1 PAAR domain-containing protein [Polyangiaceae bacterium]
MSAPVAKEGDQVVGLDTHVVMVSSPGGPVPTPLPHPFSGLIQENVSTTVFLDHHGVALVDSVANGSPPHVPMGGPFQTPPSNRGTISQGSSTVFVENRAVARSGDPVRCCNDPTDQDTGHVIAAGVVYAK